MKKYILLGTALLTLLGAASCKKTDDDTTNTPSLSGLTVNQVPPFLPKGTTLTYKANVDYITVSKGDMPATLGLCWQVNSAKRDTLTRNTAQSNPDYVYTADTLGTYNVFCYAYATGYYSASASSSFIVVDPETVLTDVEDPSGEVTVNGITWKAGNLNNGTCGLSFRNSSVLDAPMGRMYNWQEAQTACPAGWHLPSLQDFKTSFAETSGVIHSGDLMADASFRGEKMWEYWSGVTVTNKYGFNAIPLGYIDSSDTVNTYDKWGEYACWWTSDSAGGMGVYLYLFEREPEALTGKGDKESLYLSVRCIKD